MKLWQKNYTLDKEIEEFTTGNDYELDNALLEHDCKASQAHAQALKKAKILTKQEYNKIKKELEKIEQAHIKGQFEIKQEHEDCHTAIENQLTKKLGKIGKKIHTARSRNDQVLTAIRLYEKQQITEIEQLAKEYELALTKKILKVGKIPIPGYTHTRKAMPTTIGTWLNCYEDSLKDNMTLLKTAYYLIDQSPLGSAAGYGVPIIKLDRKMTSKNMGFSRVQKNPIYCQMSRGKFEITIIHALSQIMYDLNKLATDLILYSTEEFGYLQLPYKICTGSSIMPQKKNPDPLELVRANYHVINAQETAIKGITANLTTGYHRDLQLTKEPLIKAIEITKNCLKTMTKVVTELEINTQKCKKSMTPEIYSTQEALKLTLQGVPFRDAYKKIAKQLNDKDQEKQT